MEIARDHYLDELIWKQGNGLVKIVTGIRRCGKSYLLRTMFKRHLLETGVPADHILEMAFDLFENERFQDPHVFLPYIKQQIADEGQYYVLLDEVQLLGRFEAVLNSLMDMENVDVYVTGSNARFLSRDIATEFGGRGDEINLMPLSFSEFMSVYPGDRRDGWDEYVMYGGLPPVVLQRSAADKIKLLNDLLKETYIRDIVGRHRIRNKAEFEELIDILASGIGSLTNPTKLANTFLSVKNTQISKNTVKSYLDYLEDAFMVEAAKRYDIRGRHYIGAPYKYYFSDIGLRNARINFRQQEPTHTMENVIYNELRGRGFAVDVGIVEFSERDESGKSKRKQVEVDFVCNRGSERCYVQSAFAMPDREKLVQEERPFMKIDDYFSKIIVVKDAPAPWYTDQGILVMGIFDFLLNPGLMDYSSSSSSE